MTEAEIINGCNQKKTACQRELFEQYSGRLMTLCLRYCNNKPDAEDVLQEAFIKIFNSIHQYKFKGSFEGWMKKIAVNCALKKLGKKKIKFEEMLNDETVSVTSDTAAWDILTEKELMELIQSLPDGYRVIFNLHVLEEYSHEEIAAMLKIKAVTSRSQLLKARKMLQKKLSGMQKVQYER